MGSIPTISANSQGSTEGHDEAEKLNSKWQFAVETVRQLLITMGKMYSIIQLVKGRHKKTL